MALIPPDAAIRLRMQTEASLSPVAPLKELSAKLPDLQPGHTFTARIQQALPENSFRALVDGREITLSLPEAAKAGDTLELVVVERSSRMVVAELASQVETGSAHTANTDTPQLSPAARLIGKLLLPAGQEPQPAALNQGEPLLTLPLPPAADLAATLAPRLAQAAVQSGLFYEAHQAQWLAGQHTTEALLDEPQARHAVVAKAVIAHDTALPIQNAPAKERNEAVDERQAAGSESAPAISSGKDLLQSIPAELRPLVQQQLDAAATQRLSWQGEVWPGQNLQWQISRETPDKTNLPTQDEAELWNTSLALTTPRLGRIEAAMGIAGNTVRIRLTADSAESVSKLNSRLAALSSAFEAAGLKPIGLQVRDVDA